MKINKPMIVKTYRKTPDIYPLHDIRVVDGDTLEATIILPFDVKLQKRIRLKGWWADELDGPYANAARTAQLQLQVFLEGKAIWLLAASCRLDKYGRIIGHIMHGEQILDPRSVLGNYQLTEAEHKARSDQAKAARAKSKELAASCASQAERGVN